MDIAKAKAVPCILQISVSACWARTALSRVAFPSSQVPALGAFTQPEIALQLSSVQALPSSQLLERGAFTHPAEALQLSSVQTLPSSQLLELSR